MTNKGLTYSKDKTKPPLGSIPVCDILGAERLGEDSFHSKLVSLTVRVQSRGGSRILFRRGCTRLLLYFNTNKPHSFFLTEYRLY